MASGEDWLFRPVVRGCCSLESLLDGTLSLADIADINDALDVQDENAKRHNDYLNPKRS
jgi:hypothetical protein